MVLHISNLCNIPLHSWFTYLTKKVRDIIFRTLPTAQNSIVWKVVTCHTQNVHSLDYALIGQSLKINRIILMVLPPHASYSTGPY